MPPIIFQCPCGRALRTHSSFAGTQACCPSCGQTVSIPGNSTTENDEPTANESAANEPTEKNQPAEAAPKKSLAEHFAMEIEEFFEPPKKKVPPTPEKNKTSVAQRMFEAILDPKSIQWILTIGGGLLILGLIVLLVHKLDIKTPIIISTSMLLGTLAIMAIGWWVTLKTSHKTAGRALTFLASVFAPLNLWYLHAQDLVTLQNHLWVGGVLCSLLYIATVRILRDSLFLYAVEAGITLTVLLFLPTINVNVEASSLSIALMILGLISIHCERLFSAESAENNAVKSTAFSRKEYGLPLFWSGQAQVAVALMILFGTQSLGWLDELFQYLFGSGFQQNLLTKKPLLAGGLWLVGTYAYLYSDLVVRRIGLYIYIAAFSLLMAIVTIVGWQFESAEAIIIALAVAALGANIFCSSTRKTDEKLGRIAIPFGLILSTIALAIGWGIHNRVNSFLWSSTEQIGTLYIVAMLLVTASARISAYLFRHISFRLAAIYLFFSAGALLLTAAGTLPLIGVEQWFQQIPLLMLIPIGYLLVSRMWRGHSLERPLGWIAQVATGILLFHTLIGSLGGWGNQLSEFGTALFPLQGETLNLFLGCVFAEAALFYAMAGLFRKRSLHAYLSALAACGALWQWLGYFDIAPHYHTLFFAVLGIAGLIIAQSLGLERKTIYRETGEKTSILRGRGLTTFQSANAILLIALLSVFWQSIIRLLTGETLWSGNIVLLITTGISAAAVVVVPTGDWRKVYTNSTIVLAGLAVLTLSVTWLKELSFLEKVELVSVLVGIALLITSHIGKFRETNDETESMVGIGLFLGSFFATLPLLFAIIYHRTFLDEISFSDELGIITITVLMIVSGCVWKTKAPTLIGGGNLLAYLILLITELARRAEQMLGIAVFMTIAGGVLFLGGIFLSIYREKLLALPEKIAKREGIFRIIGWR